MSNLHEIMRIMNDESVLEFTLKFKESEIKKIEVRGGMTAGSARGEGNIPHMHVWNKKRNETCIILNHAAYFRHGYIKYTLSDDEMDDLNELLKKPYAGSDPTYHGYSNWEAICRFWNDHNDSKFQLPSSQPDYSKNIMSESEYKKLLKRK